MREGNLQLVLNLYDFQLYQYPGGCGGFKVLNELTLEAYLLLVYLYGQLLTQVSLGTCSQHISRPEHVIVLRETLADLLNDPTLLRIVALV